MKTLKQSNLFSTTLAMLLVFSVIWLSSCEKDNLLPNDYSKAEYLELSEGADFANLSEQDNEILGQAFGRINVYVSNGFYHLKQISGDQVNISEELFDYFRKATLNTNEKLKPKSFNQLIPRLKSGSNEGGNGDDDVPKDCVAHAIKGAGGDYAAAIEYLNNHYGGNGVPPEEFIAVLKHFFPRGEEVSTIYHGAMNNAIVTYAINDSTWHSVNGTSYDANNGIMLYYDNQSGSGGFVMQNDIKSVFVPDFYQ